MGKPVTYNFPDSYRRDGLQPFKIKLRYKSGNPVALENAHVRMQLRNSLQNLAWEFSSTEEGDRKITILPDGEIQFPRIVSWEIPATKYYYDLQVTDYDGYVRTYMSGSWKINQDITY